MSPPFNKVALAHLATAFGVTAQFDLGQMAIFEGAPKNVTSPVMEYDRKNGLV
jgi:hypothetical protein